MGFHEFHNGFSTGMQRLLLKNPNNLVNNNDTTHE